MKRIASRYLASTIGLLFVALGIALTIISNLGTSPLSCPPYILSLWARPSVGEFTVMVNTALILVQLAVLRRQFKLKYLMQIPASFVFGYMIDFWLWALASVSPATLFARFALVIVSCIITAFGVSLEVGAQGWMLSAELTVYAFTKVSTKRFGTIKVWMDCLYVVIAAVISYLIFRNPFGYGEFTTIPDVLLSRVPGVVIGIGTIFSAIIPGWLMHLTDPWMDSLLTNLRKREEDRKWRRVMNRK